MSKSIFLRQPVGSQRQSSGVKPTSSWPLSQAAEDEPAWHPPEEAEADATRLCPPEAFPSLYPELAHLGDVDPAWFDLETLRESLGSGSISKSAGWTISKSFNGVRLADYAENPFSRRKSDYIPSPSTSLDNKARWLKYGSPSLETNFLSEGLIGSLPKTGMVGSLSKSGRHARALSPAALKKVPEEKIAARTLEGLRLRRKLLKGKVLVFISAGYSGKRFIYEKVKELGVRSVLLDGPDSWSRTMAEEGIIEKFVPFDWSDNETVFDRCVEAVTKVEQELGQVDGVLSFWEVAQPLVARLSAELGLPGNTPEAVDNAREKQRTREMMRQAGLPTPKNHMIRRPEDVEPAGNAVGFPAVIKPISGAASLGVVRVDSLAELRKTYQRVTREVAAVGLNAKGDFVQGVFDLESEQPSGTLNAAGSACLAHEFILEQYLDGPEVDVDVVLWNGEAVYGSITDNWPTIEPYFNETGSNCPSVLPMHQQRELCQLAVQAVQALGFTVGVFHVEAKYTSHGPHIIEVNARMGGGPVRTINMIVWGPDLIEESLFTAAGIPSRPLVARRPMKEIAEYSVNAKESGVLASNTFLQHYVDHPDVMYIRYLVEAGEKIVSVSDGLPSWVYEMMVTKPTVQEAIEFVKHIEHDCPIPLAPAK